MDPNLEVDVDQLTNNAAGEAEKTFNTTAAIEAEFPMSNTAATEAVEIVDKAATIVAETLLNNTGGTQPETVTNSSESVTKRKKGRGKQKATVSRRSTCKVGGAAAARPKKKKAKSLRQGHDSYKIYLYKVLKEVHPNTGISSQSMSILDSLMKDIFERIAVEASVLAKYSKKATISSLDIQSAVTLVFGHGELGEQAKLEGAKAVTRFNTKD